MSRNCLTRDLEALEDIPQGLKPGIFPGSSGTTKFVPFQDELNAKNISSFRRNKFVPFQDELNAKNIRVNWSLRSVLLAAVMAFLLLFALRGHAASVPGVDAAALLKRSDTFRNGWPSFVTRVKITNY